MPLQMNAPQRELAQRNLLLVRHVLKLMNLSREEDAYGAGCVGLCRAAALWHEGGCAFSTFACHLIRHEVLDYLDARGAARRAEAHAVQEADVQLWYSEEGYRRVEDRDFLGSILAGRAADLSADELAALRLLAGGKTAVQAAEALRVSPATVYLLRRSAADKIKKVGQKPQV